MRRGGRWRVLSSCENSSACRCDRDRKAEPSKPFQEVSLQLNLVDLLQIVSAEFLVGAASVQHGVGDDEHGVSNSHHCSLDTRSCSQALELCREVAVLLAGYSPGRLTERSPSPLVAPSCGTGPALPCSFA